MSKKRTWTDAQLIAAVPVSRSFYEVLKRLGLSLAGGTHASVKQRCRQLECSTSHFCGKGWCKGELRSKMNRVLAIPLNEILIEESTYTNLHRLKIRLLAAGLLKPECYECSNKGEWRSKPLSLQMDHIDGNRCNNLIDNLRLLCPNCHSQTPTFTGRNKSKR